MNDFWQKQPKERLKLWRQFRKNLKEYSIKEMLNEVLAFWNTLPISSNTIDIYDETTWPKPWDLVWEGEYDENNIALGMAYTIALENYAQCKILLVQNTEESYIALAVLVDDTYVLNLSYNSVSKKDVLQNCQILKEIDVSELT